MHMRFLLLLSALGALAPAFATPPTPIRVSPDALPAYILVEITRTRCTERQEPGYEGIWYATVKAKTSDIDVETTDIRVILRDPDTDVFLFNPGIKHQVEQGFLLHSIAFNEQILDQIVFEFREGMRAIYLIYLGDFYSGEPC